MIIYDHPSIIYIIMDVSHTGYPRFRGGGKDEPACHHRGQLAVATLTGAVDTLYSRQASRDDGALRESLGGSNSLAFLLYDLLWKN